MNKRLVYILASLLTVLVIFLTVFMVFGIMNNGFSLGNYNTVIKEKTYDLNDIKDIDFGLVSSDVKFLVSNTNELRVVQYGNEKSKKFKEEVTENSIEITDETQFNIIFFGFSTGSRYEVYLPNSYANKLNVRTVSGEIFLDDFDLKLKDLVVKSTSGDISLDSNMKADSVEVKSVSGEITTNNLTGEDVFIKTTSGDIRTGNINSQKLTVSTISGSLSLKDIIGEVKISSTSGDIRIDELLILDDSEISSVSGEITIRMDENNNCSINTSSLSGDKDVSSKKYGESKYDLKIKTTSGDIRVD